MNDTVDPILELLLGKRLRAQVATGDILDVRAFSVRERMSELFQANVVFQSTNQSIDFDGVIGQPASLEVRASDDVVRTYQGVASNMHQLETANGGVATYQLEIVPTLWFATQRRNHRMFQHESDPDIVLRLLEEWRVENDVRFDRSSFKKRKYRVQYAETDYAFIKRLLEDAGIAFYFDAGGVLVLTDKAEKQPPRGDIRYNHDIAGSPHAEQITDVNLGQRLRPGRYVIRDHDYRRASSFLLQAEASEPRGGIEAKLEHYHYVPGAFLFEADKGGDTPSADDKGTTRHDPAIGAEIAQRRLEAKRGTARLLSFQTNSLGLRVGDVLSMTGHPHAALAEPILVLETVFSGAHSLECGLACEATSATIAHRPELTTVKPRVQGVESATVVGPAGQEIHTDEFGRVRVHFHWDRESKRDDTSSCWIHVSQPSAGAMFGAIHIPRVGQEVIVDFLGGDPDRPVIVGRVFTNLQRVPYPLPANQTKSGWRSQSTPGGDGYNEILFEDKKGSELLSMHAERDMTTVVERDETRDVMNDRRTSIGRDESVIVSRNRARSVAANESIGIGGSRTRTVAQDDTLTVGGVVTRSFADEWRTIRGDSISAVSHDVHETIHNDRFRLVANDETFTVGNNLAGSVSGSCIMSIDKAYAIAIGGGASRTVGTDDVVSVGAGQAIDVGAALVQTVGLASTELVGGKKTITAGEAVELAAGVSKLTVRPDGAIELADATLAGVVAKLQIEGHVHDGHLAITFGDAQLRLYANGAISLVGKSLDFNGRPVTAAPSAPPPPVVWPSTAAPSELG